MGLHTDGSLSPATGWYLHDEWVTQFWVNRSVKTPLKNHQCELRGYNGREICCCQCFTATSSTFSNQHFFTSVLKYQNKILFSPTLMFSIIDRLWENDIWVNYPLCNGKQKLPFLQHYGRIHMSHYQHEAAPFWQGQPVQWPWLKALSAIFWGHPWLNFC